jgi:hypothetical protein
LSRTSRTLQLRALCAEAKRRTQTYLLLVIFITVIRDAPET